MNRRTLCSSGVVAVITLLCTCVAARSENSVVIPDQTVSGGHTGVIVPIRITNDITLRSVLLPLEIRGDGSGAFPTALTLGFRERLKAPGVLAEIQITNQYSAQGTSCKNGTPGGMGGVPLYTDTLAHPVASDPWFALFNRVRIFSLSLLPGSDAAGSMLIIMDIGPNSGSFVVDSSCHDPSGHLAFINESNQFVAASFRKSTITVIGDQCSCPDQGDIGPRSSGGDGYVNLVDIVTLIDEVFLGGPTSPSDPDCPRSRADMAPGCGDGFTDVLDLNYLIDYAFMGGPHPCDPCALNLQ